MTSWTVCTPAWEPVSKLGWILVNNKLVMAIFHKKACRTTPLVSLVASLQVHTPVTRLVSLIVSIPVYRPVKILVCNVVHTPILKMVYNLGSITVNIFA